MIHNELVSRIIVSHEIIGTDLYCKCVCCFLKFTFNWHPVLYVATLPNQQLVRLLLATPSTRRRTRSKETQVCILAPSLSTTAHTCETRTLLGGCGICESCHTARMSRLGAGKDSSKGLGGRTSSAPMCSQGRHPKVLVFLSVKIILHVRWMCTL